MQKLIIFIIVGLFAQLVDGALGMAYGVTSTSLLLAFGVVPAAASASVHIAEVATTAASGISHIKFGNVDRQTVLKLIIPGSIGAFAGACFLSNLPGDIIKPYVSVFLFLLGVYVLIRFLFLVKEKREMKENIDLSMKSAIPLGLIAGFADATGGGGWGPIATPVLLSKKGSTARKVVGTVDTSEFAIALSASIGFIISLGWQEVNWLWAGALMAGGVVAAPIAAWLVRKIPAHLLGVLVGGFILFINARTLLQTWIPDKTIHPFFYAGIIAIWAGSVIYALLKNRQASSISPNL